MFKLDNRTRIIAVDGEGVQSDAGLEALRAWYAPYGMVGKPEISQEKVIVSFESRQAAEQVSRSATGKFNFPMLIIPQFRRWPGVPKSPHCQPPSRLLGTLIRPGPRQATLAWTTGRPGTTQPRTEAGVGSAGMTIDSSSFVFSVIDRVIIMASDSPHILPSSIRNPQYTSSAKIFKESQQCRTPSSRNREYSAAPARPRASRKTPGPPNSFS